MNDCQPLTQEERESYFVAEASIAGSFQIIRDLNLSREEFPDHRSYCLGRWGMDVDAAPALSGPTSVLAMLGLPADHKANPDWQIPEFNLAIETAATHDERPTVELGTDPVANFQATLGSGRPRKELLTLATVVWAASYDSQGRDDIEAVHQLAEIFISGLLRELLDLALPIPATKRSVVNVKAGIALKTIARFLDDLSAEASTA